jgi:hypothetical protein
MKRIFIVGLTGLLFFAACQNNGSSTVGKYEQEEQSQSSEQGESESHGGKAESHEGQGGSHEGQAKESAEHATTDTTLRTSGDAPREGSGAEIKTGANVPVDTTNGRTARP